MGEGEGKGGGRMKSGVGKWVEGGATGEDMKGSRDHFTRMQKATVIGVGTLCKDIVRARKSSGHARKNMNHTHLQQLPELKHHTGSMETCKHHTRANTHLAPTAT